MSRKFESRIKNYSTEKKNNQITIGNIGYKNQSRRTEKKFKLIKPYKVETPVLNRSLGTISAKFSVRFPLIHFTDQTISIKDIQDVVDSIQIKNPPFPINIRYKNHQNLNLMIAEANNPTNSYIDIEATVKDRDFGHNIPIGCAVIIDLYKDTKETTKNKIIDAVKKIFIHEFKECLHVNGIRIYDPHKDHEKSKSI